MKFFQIEPEVAGGIGEETVIDTSVWPPLISKLHYEFDDWDGSVLVTSFPCFIVTNAAKLSIEKARLGGVEFDDVLVTTSETFDDLNPSGLELPNFVWLKVQGVAGDDDFGIASNNNLVVSQRALDLLDALGMPDAEISAFPGDSPAPK